jgi:hypothetical protein
MAVQYALERLFTDQDPDLVIDTISAVLAWLSRHSQTSTQPYLFRVQHEPAPTLTSASIDLEITWDLATLEKKNPGVTAQADRMRRKKTAHHEDVAKLAAYGLSFAAISAIYPGLRIITMNHYAAPDLVYDDTPSAIKGFEVAGRTTGGHYVLTRVRQGNKKAIGKQQQLLARSDIAEAHLALWCASPRVALMAKIK